MNEKPFILFHDAKSDQLAILYRREDGDYGMIPRSSESRRTRRAGEPLRSPTRPSSVPCLSPCPALSGPVRGWASRPAGPFDEEAFCAGLGWLAERYEPVHRPDIFAGPATSPAMTPGASRS